MASEKNELLERVEGFLTAQDVESKEKELASQEKLTLKSDFWQSAEAKKVNQKIASLRGKIEELKKLKSLREELEIALFLSEEMKIKQIGQQTEKMLQKLELETYLGAPYDKNGAILSIHSGQGGTEAMDWAAMVARMYERFFERRGWQFGLISQSAGEEAGIKEMSWEITSELAYGFLKHERGTHRLVRLSPFNADNLRQTSFALVEVLPLIDEGDQTVNISSDDLEWSYSRSGGPGGQNVNKVNSAVELYYSPLDITVRCREGRSQEQNRQQALMILRAKIAQINEEKHQAELAAAKGEFKTASWGNQIRNYVLHPYKLVKDTRTEVETSQTEDVLDGDLEMFIEAQVRMLKG
ncbi:peptide chain release factor 2 [Microgenomates group bacterium]|nr:peptide chain release factor 2 [Microgenomates group bacterium]